MSCCDGSTIEIINNTSGALTIESYKATNGSITGPSDGSNIGPDGGVAFFSAQSGTGTQGKAMGNITLEDKNDNQIVLDYAFLPSNFLGNCPCTATGGYSSNGGYTIQIIPHTGAKEGQASLQYMIS
ncbi:MAG: hypothetical protein KDD47_23855 [Acidobacteria bacterium]|nr:hypothetical protein [Acidobacteriota bacterium]